MKRKHLVVVITALTLGCLTGCGGKKSDTESTQAPLETIAPDKPSETISDKLDETEADLDIESIKEIKGYTVTSDGKVLSGKEADGYLMNELLGDAENASSDNLSNSDENLESGSNNTETESKNGTSESENQAEETTLSEEEIAENQRDFTDEEYDQIQKSIDEWTYQEAIKRMGGQQ